MTKLTRKILKLLEQYNYELEYLENLDKMQTGGLEGTKMIGNYLHPKKNNKVLDLGSGLGGTARTIHKLYKCKIEGIEKDKNLVDTSKELNKKLRISNRVNFEKGDVLNLPYGNNYFNHVYMIHLGMVIPDKEKLFKGIYRVMKKNAYLLIFDFIRNSKTKIPYPVSWADDKSSDFITSLNEYERILQMYLFKKVKIIKKKTFSLRYFKRRVLKNKDNQIKEEIRKLISNSKTIQKKLHNVIFAIENNIIIPSIIIYKKI